MILSIRTPSGPFKGLWNDQKYNGSVAYGTAMAILALIDRTEAPTPALPAAATPSSPSKPAPVRSLDRDER
jgi:hypothetical protein